MECPRCRDAVVSYELRGREAVVCESCGYVGVSVQHHAERRAGESWEEALRRFRNGA